MMLRSNLLNAVVGLAFLLIVGCSTLPKGAFEEGEASWYGKPFHGRKMASGTTYNMHAMTAAHPDLPFGTRVKVLNKNNGHSAIVTITDRGPFAGGRIIDLSRAAAQKLGMIQAGTASVIITILSP